MQTKNLFTSATETVSSNMITAEIPFRIIPSISISVPAIFTQVLHRLLFAGKTRFVFLTFRIFRKSFPLHATLPFMTDFSEILYTVPIMNFSVSRRVLTVSETPQLLSLLWIPKPARLQTRKSPENISTNSILPKTEILPSSIRKEYTGAIPRMQNFSPFIPGTGKICGRKNLPQITMFSRLHTNFWIPLPLRKKIRNTIS